MIITQHDKSESKIKANSPDFKLTLLYVEIRHCVNYRLGSSLNF